MFKLVICDDEGKTTIVPLIRDEVSIGRKEGNTIRLTDRNVSRQHASLTRAEEDTFIVRDHGSFNGTKVNGDDIKEQPRKIAPGDQITIGDYSLSIRTDVSASVPMGRQMDPGDNAGIGKVTPHARLVMISAPEPGREIDLTVDLFVIGRSEEANLHINDPSISRAHARLDGDEHQWTISDLDSINGIKINGQSRDDYLLKPGDVIELGTVQLRFVAPGEPYEFQPAGEQGGVARGPSRKRLFLVLGGVGAAVVLATVLLLVLIGGDEQPTDRPDDAGEDTQELSFDELISGGKDKMKVEEWAEAARFFAQAQRLKPDDRTARELKRTALAEMEAQTALVAALEASEASDWQLAVDKLSTIPRSSQYFDLEQLKEMSAKLCEELITKARFIATSGDPDEARAVLEEIERITEAPEKCREKKDRIRQQLNLRAAGGGGPRALDPKPVADNPYGPKKPTNPYDVPSNKKGGGTTTDSQPPPGNPGGQIIDRERPPGSSGSGSITWDPLGEARAAQARGDTAAAIRILEKGGNSRAVLALLAKLYMQTGNRAGYERVARKFIRLYPTDPKTAQFKKALGE